VARYSGDAGNAMADAQNPAWNADGQKFSTPDSDNDILPPGSCAVNNACGWWFGWCSCNVINKDAGGIWVTTSPVYDVQFSRMLVKLN